MNLNPHRPWITPLLIGAFLLSAVTGSLMFFHLDSGLNKLAHEWLSWLLLGAVVLHVLLNATAFQRYFGRRTARWVIGLFAVLLALSFVPLRGKRPEPAFAPVVRSLAQAPLPVLAQVAGLSEAALKQKLADAGLPPEDEHRTLQDVVGPELRAQTNALRRVLPAPGP